MQFKIALQKLNQEIGVDRHGVIVNLININCKLRPQQLHKLIFLVRSNNLNAFSFLILDITVRFSTPGIKNVLEGSSFEICLDLLDGFALKEGLTVRVRQRLSLNSMLNV